jgi:hypothetical protein
MMSALVALIDANVFYPAILRDLIVQLAFARLFRARWTRRIEAEWCRNLLKNRPDISESRLATTRALMIRAVPDALVEGYEAIVTDLHLPDPDDRYVLAAAIHTQADVIVTQNLRDFPAELLGPHDIVAQHPDKFLTMLSAGAGLEVLDAVRQCRSRLVRPALSVEAYLAALERHGLASTAKFLNEHSETI